VSTVPYGFMMLWQVIESLVYGLHSVLIRPMSFTQLRLHVRTKRRLVDNHFQHNTEPRASRNVETRLVDEYTSAARLQSVLSRSESAVFVSGPRAS